MAAAMERLTIRAIRFGASRAVDTTAVAHDEAMRAALTTGESRRPAAAAAT